jgi:hypothetical protein
VGKVASVKKNKFPGAMERRGKNFLKSINIIIINFIPMYGGEGRGERAEERESMEDRGEKGSMGEK